ncbi:MAG: hypothetical protein AB2692_08540, partial [Candidatus Thiodiazotropha sp.]
VMPKKTMNGFKMDLNKPHDLSSFLMKTFPELERTCIEERWLDESDNNSFHSVWLMFGPKSSGVLSKATEKQIKRLCALINNEVRVGGEHENAVSTCFLEHASQLGVRKALKPYLSKEAQHELS